MACPFDTGVVKRGKEKIRFYTNVKYEMLKSWKQEVKKVVILPIVIKALGTVTGNVKKNLDKSRIDQSVYILQKTCLLGTACIL